MNIETVSKKFATNNPNITKVVVMNIVDGKTVTNKRTHYEIHLRGGRKIADDYFSALTTLYS